MERRANAADEWHIERATDFSDAAESESTYAVFAFQLPTELAVAGAGVSAAHATMVPTVNKERLSPESEPKNVLEIHRVWNSLGLRIT